MAGGKLTLYGLKTCDSTRKARRWLEARGIDHTFVDVRDDGVSPATLRAWEKRCGWETLLNRRSTTWKSLDGTQREALDGQRALALLEQYPTLIKRPVLVQAAHLVVGFDAAQYERLTA